MHTGDDEDDEGDFMDDVVLQFIDQEEQQHSQQDWSVDGHVTILQHQIDHVLYSLWMTRLVETRE
jgi:peptide deformylase